MKTIYLIIQHYDQLGFKTMGFCHSVNEAKKAILKLPKENELVEFTYTIEKVTLLS